MLSISLTNVDFTGLSSRERGPLPLRRGEQGAADLVWRASDGLNALLFVAPDWNGVNRLDGAVSVTFRTTSPAAQRIQIRAGGRFGIAQVLGRIPGVDVEIPAGAHDVGPIRFPLHDLAIGTESIGKSITTWIWEYTAGGAAVPFAETIHDVFTIIARPQSPWSDGQTGGDVPRTDVLEWACRWAAGARTEVEAATAVTKRLNELGRLGVVVWGRSQPFSWRGGTRFLSHVAGVDGFRASQFIEVLDGVTNRTEAKMNCADLSSALAIFANILGCRLQRLQVAGSTPVFPLNPLLLNGLTREESDAAVAVGGGFVYHEATVLSDGGDAVFDACVALDSDTDPAGPPSFFAPVCGVPLHAPGGYLHRLVRPAALPGIRTARFAPPRVDQPAPPVTNPLDPVRSSLYAEYLHTLDPFRSHPVAGRDSRTPVVAGYRWIGPLASRDVWSAAAGRQQEEIWMLESAEARSQDFEVSIVPAETPAGSIELLAERLTSFSVPLKTTANAARVPLLSDDAGQSAAFAVGRYTYVIQPIGETAAGVTRVLSVLTDAFASPAQ